MKTITVSVPDDVYRAVAVHAAERGTSVSSLVAEFLRSFADPRAHRARSRATWHEIAAEIGHFRGGDRLGRDELHERRLR